MTAANVRPIVDAFMARIDEVVERGVGAIWRSVPSYGRMDDAFKGEVSKAMRLNVEVLSQVLQQGREISRGELRYIEQVGAQRAEMGIPLEDVLHAYRTVLRASWEVLSEECRAASDEGALDATLEVAEAVFRYTDQISTAVADAYARAQRAIVREQEGARREFLADLLFGTEIAPEDILRRAHTFGYDLSLSYAALVGCGPKNVDRKEATVAAAASATLTQRAAEPIVLQKAEHTIALIPVDPTTDPVALPEKLVAELDGDWTFGMGGPEPGLKGIRRAYLEAREALEIGLALGIGGPVHRFDDLLLYHFLRVEPALVERFIEQTLGPLIAYDERRKGELIKTIEAYFAVDGSVKMAGERLFAHPHTVTYRLKQVESLTGWSLRDAEDKLRLQLALRAYRLAQARNDPDEAI
ncbi:MAG: helix-turn-helix domain-containing protein [Actinomycetota bacterium]|nr:helix-turn-helix domain-containing protein [Actinomycetota bacterium]